ncbi:MAG: phytoene desaturase [Actinobacteria bacterium]|nr:phytoene desaturase [Actinomycetota bacterium]
MPDYDVVVIGGGIGGLSAAALCQKAGMKTLVLEQSDRIGGCCSTYEVEGFHFDVGASVVEVTRAFEELFKRLGMEREKYIPLTTVDPIYDYCDNTRGVRFAYPTSVEDTARIIAEFSPEDAKAFLAFAEDYTPKIKGLVDNFFYAPSIGFLDTIKLIVKYPQMLSVLPMFVQTHQKIVAKYFKNDDVLASMAFQSFYAGMPPDMCAGLYAIVGLLEHEGIYYPEGGMIRIPAGIQQAFEDLGGETRFGARALRVMVEGRTARGVELWDGTQITAGSVVGAINAKKLYEDLVGREHIPWHVWRGVQSLVLSMPCPMIYLGVDYEPPLRAHHTLTLTDPQVMNDYWSDYYLKGKMYEVDGRPEVMGLISWASKIDPSLAPPGKHVLTHMGLAPYNLAGNDWDRYKEQYIDDAIATIERYIIPDLSEHVVYRDMATPKDLERMLLHPGGAVYGIQTDISHMAVFRPANRSKCIRNLYLAGASTHPGGGVPAVVAGGIITGGLVTKDNA